ncbi:uncharacterized protein LOC126554642 [Aphis gossypii]|uniref:uncharacterized protein LOC126554642 n=1 Tax=Aphis gossypii TaxID=80765 RepID=UPI002159AC20|nr:uncharacterized protein LOC126554642 [Aphis gossypii]
MRNFSKAWNKKVYESTDCEDERVQTNKKRSLSVTSDSDSKEPVPIFTYDDGYENLSCNSDSTPITVYPASTSKSNLEIQQVQNSYEELNFSNLANVVLSENHSAEPLPSTSDEYPKQFKRIKNIGSISNRQFKRRIKAQIEAISNLSQKCTVVSTSITITTTTTTTTTPANILEMLNIKCSVFNCVAIHQLLLHCATMHNFNKLLYI